MVCHTIVSNDYLMLIFICHAATQFRRKKFSPKNKHKERTFLRFLFNSFSSHPQKIAFIIITLTPIKREYRNVSSQKNEYPIHPSDVNKFLYQNILFCFVVSAGTRLYIRYPISYNSVLINPIIAI